MKKPFNIFPSVGYKNSQFQIVASEDNLRIDIYNQNEIIKSVETNSKNPVLLTDLNATGKLVAKCTFNNTLFQQEIEIKEAFRLGSSVFKKAFVFDDSDYSFFLMKDRLLLYDEKKEILLTENHYSPTEIHQIDKTNYLFITRIKNNEDEIVNLGIYSTETFSMVGELLNNYQEIKIVPSNNKAWLYNKESKTIHCYDLANQTNKYFTELKVFKNFEDYFLDDTNQNIYIVCNNVVIFSNLNNLHESLEITKKANNAIDKLGNVLTLKNGILNCMRISQNSSETIKLDFEINLQNEDFLYIGNDLKKEIKLSDCNREVEEIKKEQMPFEHDRTSHYHKIPINQRKYETYTTHRIFPTTEGIFIIENNLKREFNGVKFQKNQDNWTATPYFLENIKSTLSLFYSDKEEILIKNCDRLKVCGVQNSMLFVSYNYNLYNLELLFCGENKFTLDKDDSVEDIFTVNERDYFLIKSKEKYSLFRSDNLNNAILTDVDILNIKLFKEHKVIWYYKDKALNAFDLRSHSIIYFKAQNLHPKYVNYAKFFEEYALFPNKIIFNPVTLEVKDALIGSIESCSKQLNKIVFRRAGTIYLSIFDSQKRQYESFELSFDNESYKESYLSPDGQFLVLLDESNKYSFYDIQQQKTIHFISGNFLSFRNDGSLIVEQKETKAVKIIDPKTFQDITPPNYRHYRFLSPDGKLYAQVSSKERYFHKLNGNELTKEEVLKLREDLQFDFRTEQKILRLKKNQERIYEEFKEIFNEKGIEDYNKITSFSIIEVNKYTEIGIVGTDIIAEIQLPVDLKFHNHSAFSYDNKYFGCVGKPSSKGFICISKIDFNEEYLTLNVVNTYSSRHPRYASWVCGFSKTGYFATYDSTPNTYICFANDDLFDNKTTDSELNKSWNVINGKNYLCFSPSGNYMALSEQGYEPLTLGGYGHQESNAVHIAKTENRQIIDSFCEHGDKIKNNKTKNVTFVAFSEDESKIMTLSSDGVVIIRDINIKNEEN